MPVLKLNHDSPRTRTRAVQGGGVVSDRDARHKATTSTKDPEESLYSKEILMENFNDPGIFSSFALARALPDSLVSAGTQMWPPLRFPAASRTRNSTSNEFHSAGHRPTALSHVSQSTFRLRKWAEYTTSRQARGPQNFANGGGGRHGPGSAHAFFSSRMSAALGGAAWGGLQLPTMLRRPEDVTTYATLRAADLPPTAKKPYQGIWVGDYSGHGCELLVIRQPDPEEAGPLPEGMEWLAEWFAGGDRRRGSDSSESFVSAVSAPEDLPEAGSAVVDDEEDHSEAHPDATGAASASVLSPTTTGLDPAATGAAVLATATGARDMLQGFIEIPYRRTVQEVTDVADAADLPSGRLEAIKLTGDVNIPRGEYTFIAPEIGPGGFMRVADEETFAGARIVRSAGHLAGRGFVHGMFLFPFLFLRHLPSVPVSLSLNLKTGRRHRLRPRVVKDHDFPFDRSISIIILSLEPPNPALAMQANGSIPPPLPA